MTEKKKIKIKVKKRKLNIKKVILFLLIIYLLYFTVFTVLNLKITNIYITNNHILSDKEIITIAKLDDYPSFLLTLSHNIEKRLIQNDYIKSVIVTKDFFGIVKIKIDENRVLFINNNKIVLENKKEINNIYNIDNIPYLLTPSLDLIDDYNAIYDEFVIKMNKVSDNILLKTSEIFYASDGVDKKRFGFMMNDGNLVYITLDKIELINKYNEMVKEFDSKKGILHLDSGSYFEIKE